MKFLYFTMACVSIATTAVAPARVFEDKFGRTIEAELVSHTGASAENVTISKGGKKMVVKIDQFSQADQEFIRVWMAKTPPKVEYNFRVTPKRIESPAAGENAETTEKYELQITNLARVPVEGLTAEYRIYYRDYPSSVDDVRDLIERGGGIGGFGGAGRRGLRRNVEPALKHIEAKAPITVTIPFNQSAVIETKPVTIHSGKNPFSGQRFSDELVGTIVRILDPGGNVVFEHRDKKTADFLWKAEEKSEEFGISLD